MIKPINYTYSIKKMYSKNIFETFTNNMWHTSKKQNINRLKYVIPLVATPLIAYNTKTDAKKRELAKILEKGKSNTPVTDNTETNTKALRKLGVRKVDIAKELDDKGKLKNESIKKELNSKNISSKGRPQNDISNETSTYENGLDTEIESTEFDNKLSSIDTEPAGLDDGLSPEYQARLDEFDKLIPELDPELKEVLDVPDFQSNEDFIEMVFGDLPEGAEADWDLVDMLKDMAEELFDIGYIL